MRQNLRVEVAADWLPAAQSEQMDYLGLTARLMPILVRMTGQPVPWQWWNDRDVRTIVELGKAIGFDPKRDMPFKGTRHNALDDAIHQAKYVSAIWKKLAK